MRSLSSQALNNQILTEKKIALLTEITIKCKALPKLCFAQLVLTLLIALSLL